MTKQYGGMTTGNMMYKHAYTKAKPQVNEQIQIIPILVRAETFL
jgi:hypothetical protein